MSAPVYHVSRAHGLLRTDDCPRPGYGRAVQPHEVITLAAQRAELRQRNTEGKPC